MTNSNENLETYSSSVYIKVFIMLTILTGLTLLQPVMIHMDYAPTMTVQMIIAFVKMTLVVLYYMHIKGASSIYKKMIFAVLLLIVVLSTFTAIDMHARLLHNDFFSY